MQHLKSWDVSCGPLLCYHQPSSGSCSTVYLLLFRFQVILPAYYELFPNFTMQAGILAVGRGNTIVEPVIGSDGMYLHYFNYILCFANLLVMH